MPRQPRQPAPAAHPDVAAGGIRRTRHYLHALIATLKDCDHQPEHVRQVLQELLTPRGAGVRFKVEDLGNWWARQTTVIDGAEASDGWREAGLVCQACGGDAPGGKCKNRRCIGRPIVEEIPEGAVVTPPDRSLPNNKPTRIPTAWGDFWAIGDSSGRIFLSEEEAAAAIALRENALKGA